MRKLIADAEAEQIDKLEKAGMQITRPDLAPFPRSAPAVSNPHGLGADTQQLVQAQ